jgi:uncharacterized protein YoxC
MSDTTVATGRSSMFMTEAACNSKHRPVVWAVAIIFVALAVILTIVSIGVSASYNATQDAATAAQAANRATQALEVYKAGQSKDTQYIISSLNRLETDIKELKSSIKELHQRVGQVRLTSTKE